MRSRIDFKLTSLWFKSVNGSAPIQPLRLWPLSPLHSFKVAPFFSRHLRMQHTFLLHKVKWSALFLLPSSNNMEQTPHFCLSRILCQFLQIFLENLSLSANFFFIPPALRCLCVSRCVFVCRFVGGWVCACVCCLCSWTFDIQISVCVRFVSASGWVFSVSCAKCPLLSLLVFKNFVQSSPNEFCGLKWIFLLLSPNELCTV